MASSLETEERTRSCVTNLIQSFTNGLDIFKRLRERRRKRKHAKLKDKPHSDSSEELQLSKSLRRGTTDIQSQYEKHYCKAGDRFAKGDAIAHASLAETLIKLNTGLVSIIATFLNHDTKTHLNLDYKSLTSLSDASRAEAIDSLNHLYQRLSQSQLHIYRIGACAQCGSMKHQNCPGVITRYSPPPKGSRTPDKKRQTSLKSRSTTHTIARVPLKSKSSSHTQLAIVRPRATRKGSSSSSSNSSTKSQSVSSPVSSPLISPVASPLASPLPQYARLDPFPTQKSPKANTQTRPRADSFDGPRPTTWPHTRPDNTISLPPPPPPPKVPNARKASPWIKEKQQIPTPGAGPIPRPLGKSPWVNEKQKVQSPGPSPISRRLDKPTPSTYTFASDSTKLGEIPQRNWTTPWNYEEAGRLNAEALVRSATASVESKPKPKKKLFGFMRRGTGERS